MSKTIQFSSEEINELRTFYSNELASAEERIKNIRGILAKIGDASSGRDKKSELLKTASTAIETSSSAKKKRGRPEIKTKQNKEELNKTLVKRGRPVKSATSEILPPVDTSKKRGRKPKLKPEQVNTVLAVSSESSTVSPVGKKRGRKPKLKPEQVNTVLAVSSESNTASPVGKKRGRKPKNQLVSERSVQPALTKSNATEDKAKRRGRKPLSANQATSITAIEGDKVQSNAAITGAKRGRKPGKKVDDLKSSPSMKSKAEGETEKNKTKIAVTVAGAKRGRKPAVPAVTKEKTRTSVKKNNERKKNVKIKPADLVALNSELNGAQQEEEIKSDATNSNTSEAPRAKSVKNLAKVKTVITKPAKVVSVKKSTSKQTKKAIPSETNTNKVKDVVTEKKVSKKVLYQDLIFKTFATEPRFYSTEEIVNAGIKEFNLKGKEKDAAKNTIQFILNGLQSQNKILRRRKEKNRQAYWASLGTSDEGYIQ